MSSENALEFARLWDELRAEFQKYGENNPLIIEDHSKIKELVSKLSALAKKISDRNRED